MGKVNLISFDTHQDQSKPNQHSMNLIPSEVTPAIVRGTKRLCYLVTYMLPKSHGVLATKGNGVLQWEWCVSALHPQV